MVSTTYFGNRARCSVLESWTATTLTLTTGSTAFSSSVTAAAGDYVCYIPDGQEYSTRCASSTTLSYAYKGTGGAGIAGYICTPTPFQVLRGLEVNFEWDMEELYGTDSIFRQDEAKHNLKITNSVRYCKWDSSVTGDWMMKVLRPSGATGEVEDTNRVYIINTVYTITGSAGGTLDIVLGQCYYEGLPYPFPENDFIIRELKGHARKGVVNYY